MSNAVVTAASSATAPSETKGAVLVSGSYGGIYNAWHAVRKGASAVILNDAGVGKNQAGISGLEWLDALGIPGAAADCMTCHIGDGDHMLGFGRISFVNEAASALGCRVGQTVADGADAMRKARPTPVDVPVIEGGKRFTFIARPNEPIVIGLDAAPLLVAGDVGAIAVTGSHAALFRGQPDSVISVRLRAVFFNDAGVGLDEAGISRLPELDKRGMPAGTVSCMSAEIGSAQSAWDEGILSHLNSTASGCGLVTGMRLADAVALLSRHLANWK